MQARFPLDAEGACLGLRERKKARTHAEIQRRALALFRQRGYEATTVQQIADAAEVSQSTFFRYFPSKADVVLWDELDPLIVSAFARQPASLRPIQAIRAALHETFAQLSAEQREDQMQRTRLVLSVPELRARMLDEVVQSIGLLAKATAQRTRASADDISARAFAGAVVGVAMSAAFTVAESQEVDLAAVLDDALSHLEAGLI